MLTSSILSLIIIKLLSFDPKFQLNSETLVECLNLIKYIRLYQVATSKYTMQYILLRLYFCNMFKVEHGNNMVTVSRPVQHFYTYSDTHSSNMNSELSSHQYPVHKRNWFVRQTQSPELVTVVARPVCAEDFLGFK